MEEIRKEEKDKSLYPDVVVKIGGELYCINSRNIIAIANVPGYNRMPGTPKEVLGVMEFRGEAVPLIDIRTLFGLPALKKELEDFGAVIDARKEDHVKWVNKLEETARSGEEFPLATDPHQCAFGQWFYQFQTENGEVKRHLHKIEEPHRRLHEAALEIEKCKKEQKDTETLIRTIKEKYMAEVMTLLDESKEVFRNLYTEMMIVLEVEGRQLAIVIDEVLEVDELMTMDRSLSNIACPHSRYICEVKQRANGKDLILELNDNQLMGIAEEVEEIAKKEKK